MFKAVEQRENKLFLHYNDIQDKNKQASLTTEKAE